MALGIVTASPTNNGLSNNTCILPAIANAAGSGAGASVTTAVSAGLTDQFGTGKLPGSYSVLVTPSQASCTVAVTSKTASGFNVILTPSSATATLAAGTFDVVICW